MKLALIAITKHGIEHARALKAAMPEAELHVSEKQRALASDAQGYFPAIKDFTAAAWDKYDGLVYFVSLGAVVRTVAPFLKGKDVDPAVVTVDDGKRFAVSLLSGHVGGANELTDKVAAALGCQAVVTTASDARATIPVDILGRELGWVLEDKANVTAVSAAVVNERPVAFIQESGEGGWWTRPTPLPANIRLFKGVAEAKSAGAFEAYLVVSDRALDALKAELGEHWDKVVVYRPKTLCLGMGCDAGTDLEEVLGLVQGSLEGAGLSEKCVRSLASIDLKAKEEALHQLAGKLGIELKFFTRDELNARGVLSEANPVVEKYTGAVGVCEPAAMLSAGSKDLLVFKQKSKRATLAVARRAT